MSLRSTSLNPSLWLRYGDDTLILWPHRAKTIRRNSDAYQEEMKSLRDNLPRNDNPESLTSSPRNLDRTTENDTQKLNTVCLGYVKGLAEKI